MQFFSEQNLSENLVAYLLVITAFYPQFTGCELHLGIAFQRGPTTSAVLSNLTPYKN